VTALAALGAGSGGLHSGLGQRKSEAYTCRASCMDSLVSVVTAIKSAWRRSVLSWKTFLPVVRCAGAGPSDVPCMEGMHGCMAG